MIPGTLRLWAALLAALLVGADPGHACSVCSAPDAPDSAVYTISTAFLSLLPLLTMGGMVLWVRRALRRQKA